MQNELTCPLCNKDYKDDNLPRLLTTCGHTYCENCIKSLMKPIYLNNNNLIDLEETQNIDKNTNQQKKLEANLLNQKSIQNAQQETSSNQQQQFKKQETAVSKKQDQEQLLDQRENAESLEQKKDQSEIEQKIQQENKPDETKEESQQRSKQQGDISQQKSKQEAKQEGRQQVNKSKEQEIQVTIPQNNEIQLTASQKVQVSKPIKQQKRKPQKYRIQCPEDKNIIEIPTNEITLFPKNLALIKLIQNKKHNLSFKDDDSSFNVSKIAKTQQMQEDEQANELITAIKQGEQADSKSLNANQAQSVELKEDQKQEKQEKQPQICLLHQKQLQIVCMKCVMRICANCAIFGGHKGHDFKSLEQIQNEKQQYQNKILHIIDLKQIICGRMQNQQTLNDLLSILQTRKQKVKRDIKDRYKQLREELDKFEKQDIKNLDNLAEKTSWKIKNALKIDENVLSRYSVWENESYQHLKIMGGNNFQEKLELIFPRNQLPNTVIQRGLQIISQIKQEQDSLLPQVQQIIQGIKIVNSDSIYKTLSSFVVVTDQTEQKPVISIQNNQQLKNPQKKQASSQQNSQNVTGSPQMEQSLLETEEIQQVNVKKPQFQKQQYDIEQSEIKIERVTDFSPIQKLNIESIGSKKKETTLQETKVIQKNEQKKQNNPSTLRSNFMQVQPHQRPNKKKLTKLKVQQKYQKIVDGIANDTLENVDLSFAQLGDQNLTVICQFLRGSKAKNVKLIRNKLTDQGLKKIIPYFGNLLVLNLSQNVLTQNVLDIFIDNLKLIPNLKNLILSQNKIVERKSKARLQKLRALGLTVSV